MEGNPAGTPPVRVRFGTGPDDSIPLSWAESMLTELQQNNRSVFGKLISKVALGTAARP